jgi:hypothetical protein
MIVAEINLVSAVSSSRNKIQARLEIFNDGTGTRSVANYGYRIFNKAGKILHTGTIENFPRQKMLALDLVMLALVDARGEKAVRRYAL